MSPLINKRISAHKKMVVPIIFLTVLFVLTMLLFAVTGFDKKSDAVMFDWSNEDNSYVYVDVIALDDEACAYINEGSSTKYYYTVIDTDYYYDIVIIKDSDIKKMGTQIKNYSTGTETEVYRLYGTAHDMGDDLINIYADVYDITYNEVLDNFGGMYVDATSTPGTSASIAFLVLALIVAACDAYLIFLYTKNEKRKEEIIKSIHDSNEELQIEEDIRSANGQLINNDSYVLGDYCIVFKTNIIPYRSILWAYQHNVVDKNVVKKSMAYVYDSRQVFIPINVVNNDFDTFFGVLQEKNPEILFGYNEENRKAILGK